MTIPTIKNIIYNGVQEGINYDLHIFTEKTTGGSFGIRTTIKDIEIELKEKIKQLIYSFK